MNGNRETHQLCYVKGRWAYFASVPVGEVWGDDWNDAPYEHNAGNPYDAVHRDGVRVPIEIAKVAFDADLETPADIAGLNSNYSVEQINAKATPWLTSSGWGSKDTVRIWAGATLAEFRALVAEAGGDAYEKASVVDGRAYARGALDMQARAEAVATAARPKRPPSGEYDRGCDDTAESIADDIKALDAGKQRETSPLAWVPRALRNIR